MTKLGSMEIRKEMESLEFNKEAWVGYSDSDEYEINDVEEITDTILQWLAIDVDTHSITANYQGRMVISMRYPK